MRKDKKKLPRGKTIYPLEDLELLFYEEEAEIVKDMWEKNYHIDDIAKKCKREQDEIAVLIMHLSRQDQIMLRKSGVLGGTAI